jgi:hypothetical protein
MVPAILLGLVVIAVAFAFTPVQRTQTTHESILGALDIQDIFAAIGTAANGNSNAITVDLLVTSSGGKIVTGLTDTDFAAFEVVSGAGETITSFAVTVSNSGNGVYRLTVDPTGNWGAGRHDVAVRVTSGINVAWALVVADIP